MPTGFKGGGTPPGAGPSPQVAGFASGSGPVGPEPRAKPAPRVAPPQGKPVPVLQQNGFSGSIEDFNSRVEAVVNAHHRTFGTKPSPALVIAVARNAQPDQYDRLFAIQSHQHAESIRVLRAAGITRPEDVPDPSTQLVKAISNVKTRDELDAFFAPENEHVIEDALDGGDLKARNAFLKAYTAAEARLTAGAANPATRRLTLGFAGLPSNNSFLSRALGKVSLAGEQVSTALVLGVPTLAVAEAQGIASSVRKGSVHPFLATNWHLAKAVGTGVKRDVTDPAANPGYLLMDLFGLASLGFGAAARVSAAGAALRAGEDIGAATRALGTKARTGTYRVGAGADMPLSGNPLVARVQRAILDMRGRRQDGTDIPTSAAAGVSQEEAGAVLGRLTDPLRENFSMENKAGRQLRAADRVDRALRLALAEPLDKANGSAKSTSLVIRKIGPRGFRGLSVGEQKAIQVLSTDDPNPFATWRNFHEQMIEMGVGDEAAHRAHLAALTAAEKVVAKPSPKFRAALNDVRTVMAENERMRIDELGLSPVVAEGRVAAVGEIVRGDVRRADANTRVPALTSGDDILRFTALGHTPEQTARELLTPNPESTGVGVPTHYSSYDAALKAVKAKLATPEAKKALTPVRVRSTTKNPDAYYLPFQNVAHSRKAPTFWVTRPGPFGIPIPSRLPELTHTFTGESIRAGDFRLDATGLARESYARTVRLATKVNLFKNLYDNYATETPRTPHDIPIRDVRDVSDELRNLVSKVDDAQMLTADDVAGMTDAQVDDLNRLLTPSKRDAGKLEGVRWLDPRFLADEAQSRPGAVTRAFSNLNEPLRDLTLFVRPAYILNVLNNVQMAAMHEGVFVIPNFVRALKASEFYGPDVARALDALAGEGRMRSYAPDAGGATKISHALASAWNVVTDKFFRRAAIIHELRAAGFRTSDELAAAVRGATKDPELRAKIAEASQRAKKSMVELDNLTAVEKNALRHFIFVYPWVSRSAVWSLRTLFEHPAQVAILNEIGKSAEDEFDPVLKHLPAWMRDLGYIPVGHDAQGRPKVINPSSLSTFSTLGEVSGLVQGHQTATDLLGPGAELVLRLAEERDRFGRKYQHPYIDPIADTLGGLPQVAAYDRSQQAAAVDKPLDVTNVNARVTREHEDLSRPVRIPGSFWATYGPLIIGGLADRVIDPRAVEARWWEGQPWQERHKHETQEIQKMAGVQGAFIGKRVPDGVREALRITSALAAGYHAFAAKQGRDPTTIERTQIDIKTLLSRGELKPDEATKLRTTLAETPPLDLDRFRQGILGKHAGGDVLADWHRQVSLVAAITSAPDFDADLGRLADAGVVPAAQRDAASAPKDARLKYGRMNLDYDSHVRRLERQRQEAQDANLPTDEIDAKLRQFVDRNDKPIVVDGHTFPSLSRFAIARLTPEQLATHLAANYTRPLGSLTAVDKRLMGLPSTPAVSAAWDELHKAVADYRKQNPGERIQVGQIIAGAKAYDAEQGLGGKFLAEVKLSYAPRYERYKLSRLYTASPNKAAWNSLFKDAKVAADGLRSGDYNNADVQAAWRNYIQSEVIPNAKKNTVFWHELQPYLAADSSFLDHLPNR